MNHRCNGHDKLVEDIGEVRGDIRELRVEFAHLTKSMATLVTEQAAFVSEFKGFVKSLGELTQSLSSERTKGWFSLANAGMIALGGIVTACISKGPDIFRAISLWIGG